MATTTATTPGSTSSSGSSSHPTTADSSGSKLRPLSEAGSKRLSSFPSRQRRMGPAPLASFEDLSMDKTTSESSSPEERTTLPDIGEETSGQITPITPLGKAPGNLAVPPSPQIKVSGASSSSPQTDSKDSTPDHEIFSGYAKSEFCEQMSDLRSSTEELEGEEERSRKAKARLRQLKENEMREERLKKEELCRKESSSSVISDVLLPVTSGHSSRLSSLGSIGSGVRRSPSPHKMLLETSFCGSKPIKNPSIDIEDPPVTTTKIMNFTIDKIERVKSPIDARPPDIFRSTPSPSPIPFSKQPDSLQIEKTPLTMTRSDPEQTRKKLTKELEGRLEKQRQKLEEQEDIQRIVESRHKRQKTADIHKAERDRSEQLEELYGTADIRYQRTPSRSPRLGKKVPTPQVPDLKDFPRRSPSPSVIPPSSIIASSSEHQNAQYYSDSQSSPKQTRRSATRKPRDSSDLESCGSSPSFSRKSSLSNLFRKSEPGASPVTPDSPGSTSGRKSPFSTFLRSAKNEFRSRSRSRSRSKSRERELDDDTHDRRSVLSIFKPKTPKKKNGEAGDDKSNSNSSDIKPNEDITKVEFTFNAEDGSYKSSPVVPRKEDEGSSQNVHKESSKPEPMEVEVQEPEIFARNVSTYEMSSSTSSKDKHKDSKPSKHKPSTGDDDVFDKKHIMALEESIQEKLKTRPHKTEKIKDPESTSELSVHDQNQDADSISESDKISEVDYYKGKEKPASTAQISPDVENKGLVSQDSFEDGELPYVPTSLPQERPIGEPIIPVRERSAILKPTRSIDRPRSTTPLQPSRLEEFASNMSSMEQETDIDKMKISIAGAVKVLPTKSPKRQSSKSWEDFSQEGLRSPRQLRKQYRESRDSSNQETIEDLPPPVPPPLPPKNFKSPCKTPRSSAQTPDTPQSMTPDSIDTPTSTSPKTWINFDEIPDVVLKPARQIKTVPTRRATHQQDLQHKKKHQQQLQQEQLQQQLQQQLKQRLQEQQQKVNQQILEEEQAKSKDGIPVLPKPPSSAEEVDAASKRLMPEPRQSSTSSPDKDDSSERSSDSDERQSRSSSEDLTTVRERIDEIKGRGQHEDSDLERLLAPVNDCISHSLKIDSSGQSQRKSPIPDNWADFLLPPQPGRRSRLSSVGSDAGSVGRRSPSPHMVLETSFCGSQPIDDPALAEPDVPISVARKMSGVSLGDLSPLTSRGDRASLQSPSFYSTMASQPDRASIVR